MFGCEFKSCLVSMQIESKRTCRYQVMVKVVIEEANYSTFRSFCLITDIHSTQTV